MLKVLRIEVLRIELIMYSFSHVMLSNVMTAAILSILRMRRTKLIPSFSVPFVTACSYTVLLVRVLNLMCTNAIMRLHHTKVLVCIKFNTRTNIFTMLRI